MAALEPVVEASPPLIFDPPPLDPFQFDQRRSISGLLASMRFGRAGGSRTGAKDDRK
jgi:hypothetical protein